MNTLADFEKGTHFTYINAYALPGGPLGNMAGPAVRRVTTGEVDEYVAKAQRAIGVTVTVTNCDRLSG